MTVKQIYDKPLAHASYAIETEGKTFLVDPGRNPEPYVKFADEHNSEIIAVFETHPHADFVSSHLEFLRKYGAAIYINPKVGVSYDYNPMEHEDTVRIGNVIVKALFTPGHSPDHNSYLVSDEEGKQKVIFSGDALFVGDVGRPDLREGAGNIQVSRRELAGMMYETINNVFADLPDKVVVYPAHGPGSLCGKNMSDDLTSTIGVQKQENWAFQVKEKEKFIDSFLEGQSFIPNYFPHSVELNRKGAPPLASSIHAVRRLQNASEFKDGTKIIDTRNQETFKEGHLPGAINIQAGEGAKFETWLGSILEPGEHFYLVTEDEEELETAVNRTAKIGYEKYIDGTLVHPGESEKLVRSAEMPLTEFRNNPEQYTIVDIRNKAEVEAEKIFDSSINIPLPELTARIDEVPQGKPIVVHCAGGYRSAIGSSILEKVVNDRQPVYDLSETVNSFK